jgi:cardiolipin synthase A/B
MTPSLRYFFDDDKIIFGDQVRILQDGEEAFSAILEAIRNARKYIGFEIYMFLDHRIGHEVLSALVEAQKRGCKVRLVYDSVGSYPNTYDFFQPLVQAGGRVAEFRPIRAFRIGWRTASLDQFSRRNHRKLLVVDDDLVILGGLNVAEEYRRPVKENGVHDLGIEIRGQTAREAWRLFEETWGEPSEVFGKLGAPYATTAPEADASEVQLIASSRYLDRWRLRRTLLYAIAQAETSIDLVNPYFLPAPDVLMSLRRAARRNVRVKLLVPNSSDIRTVDLASLVVQSRLSRYGVEVYRWPGQVHAKVILIDRTWYSIGSYNLDYQSLFRNLEVVANVVHAESAEYLSRIITDDTAISKRWTIESWRKERWWVRLAARILYRLRRFL